MDSDLYAKSSARLIDQMNVKTVTLFERYLKITDEKTAMIMAFTEGGQAELAAPVLERMRTDNQMLAEETYANLVPREQLYPVDGVDTESRVRTSTFALDDFAKEFNE